MTNHTPKNLNELSPQSLAGSGEFIALAALARISDANVTGREATQLLAANANNPTVFALMWVTLEVTSKPDETRADRWKTATEAMADGLKIPAELRDEVQSFVTSTPVPQRNQQGRVIPATHWRFRLASTIVANLYEKNDWAINLAKRILDEVAAGDDRWDAAAQVLARRADTDALNTLLDHTDSGNVPARLKALARIPLSKRRKKDELRISQLLVAERHAEAGQAGPLILDLSTETAVSVLADPTYAKAPDDYLRQLNLASGSDERIKSLMSAEVPDSVRAAVMAGAGTYSLERLIELGPWLFNNDPTLGESLVNRALQQATMRNRNEDQKALWRAAAARIAVAGRNETVAVAVGQVINVDDVIGLMANELKDWEQLGAIARGLQRNEDEDEARQSIAAVLQEVPANALPDVARGMLGPKGATRKPFLVDALAEHSLTHTGLQPILIEFELEAPLVEVAEGLGGERAATLLHNVGSQLSQTSWETLSQAVTWRDLETSSSYASYLETLSTNPDLLATESARALSSLEGPESEWIRTDLLKEALRAVVNAEVAHLLPNSSITGLAKVLRLGEEAVVRLACSVMGLRTPDPDAVKALKEAHESSTKWQDAFEAARTSQAEQLSAAAENLDRAIDDRIVALRACAEANLRVAREASFRLMESPDEQLRIAAAEIIGREVPTSGELPAIRDRVEQEPSGKVQELLLAAMRRAESGDAGEALRNLYEVVRLSPDAAPDPRDLGFPVALEQQFTSAVDEVSRTSTGTAKSFATSTAVLVDLLVEVAVGVCGRAGLINTKEAEVQALLANGAAKPDVGALLIRQNLVAQFDWFGAAKVAHDRRVAHAGPKGSRDPHQFGPEGEERVTTRFLLRTVVEGFVQALIDAKQAA